MSVVHFVPCSAADGPERIGALAAGLARRAAADGFAPAAHLLDTPLRAGAAAAFAAWTAPLAAAFPATPGGSGLLLAATGSLHARSGWEGALHALAVCGAEPAVLAAIQEGVQPHVERDVCGGCGMCVTLCGNAGVRHNGHVAVIRPENCLACGDCLAECYLEALQFPAGGSARLMDRVGAAAAARRREAGELLAVVFLLRQPSRKLDGGDNRVPQADLGVLAGSDPVALDAAAAELVAAHAGQGLQALSGCPEDPRRLLEAAAAAGAGAAVHRIVRHEPSRLAG